MLRQLFGVGVLLAGASISGAHQKLSFVHAYKVGDVETYNLKMDMTTPAQMTMTVTETQEVTKVYDNGDADIQLKMSGAVVNMGGQVITPPASFTKPQTMHVSKFGGSSEIGAGRNNAMQLALSGMNGLENGIEVGQTIPFGTPDGKKGNLHTKGAVTLVEVKSGLANVHFVFDVSDDKSKVSGHTEGSYYIDTTTAHLVKMEMTSTSGGAGGYNMHLTLERAGS